MLYIMLIGFYYRSSVCFVLLTLLMYIVYIFFFFSQKTAYDMRISDWSSDVCSSDLLAAELQFDPLARRIEPFDHQRPATGQIDHRRHAVEHDGRRRQAAAGRRLAEHHGAALGRLLRRQRQFAAIAADHLARDLAALDPALVDDRKSTRLNSRH